MKYSEQYLNSLKPRDDTLMNTTMQLANGVKIYVEQDGYSCSHVGFRKGSCLECMKYLGKHLLPLLKSAVTLEYQV